jgi:polar amino acid transport system substrate-binding protein
VAKPPLWYRDAAAASKGGALTIDEGSVMSDALIVMRIDLRPVIVLVATLLLSSPVRGQEILRWGGDSEGGAPFVEADPSDPSRVSGFDVEVAEEIARGLGRTPRFVQVAFASIDQSVQRGDFDIGMSGVEDTPARRAALAATIPYYEFTETLTVRAADKDRFKSLDDLRNRRVGTLGGTIAYDILLAAEKTHGITAVSYDDDVHPYEDVVSGRLDAVLLDNIIAARSMRRTPGLYTHFDKPVATGHYIAVLARENTALRDRVNEILKARMKDGTLERIYRKWDIWDEFQARLFAEQTAVAVAQPSPEIEKTPGVSVVQATRNYLPALLKAALITIVLSCLAMALAVAVGVLVATGRVYGNALVRAILTAYVEVTRGTPVLLQLFVIYYGLSSVIRLPAFVAALVGLGLNYAAYESEIYRGAMEAVGRGQLEAARTLGLSELQVFRFIRGPQAFRLALAPMTNDFVALLKDSSLVSVITVVELTKQTQIFAANIGSWVVPGILCALLYLCMSLPLAHAARALETRWKAATS